MSLDPEDWKEIEKRLEQHKLSIRAEMKSGTAGPPPPPTDAGPAASEVAGKEPPEAGVLDALGPGKLQWFQTTSAMCGRCAKRIVLKTAYTHDLKIPVAHWVWLHEATVFQTEPHPAAPE